MKEDWILPSLLYVDNLIMCGESEEDLRAIVERFTEMYRRGLKVNTCKSKVVVLDGEEGLECEVFADGIRLEHFSEFRYLRCVLDESCTDEAECSRRVRVRGGLQVQLGLWLILGVCSLSVLGSCMRHSSCLFLGMVV